MVEVNLEGDEMVVWRSLDVMSGRRSRIEEQEVDIVDNSSLEEISYSVVYWIHGYHSYQERIEENQDEEKS